MYNRVKRNNSASEKPFIINRWTDCNTHASFIPVRHAKNTIHPREHGRTGTDATTRPRSRTRIRPRARAQKTSSRSWHSVSSTEDPCTEHAERVCAENTFVTAIRRVTNAIRPREWLAPLRLHPHVPGRARVPGHPKPTASVLCCQSWKAHCWHRLHDAPAPTHPHSPARTRTVHEANQLRVEKKRDHIRGTAFHKQREEEAEDMCTGHAGRACAEYASVTPPLLWRTGGGVVLSCCFAAVNHNDDGALGRDRQTDQGL